MENFSCAHVSGEMNGCSTKGMLKGKSSIENIISDDKLKRKNFWLISSSITQGSPNGIYRLLIWFSIKLIAISRYENIKDISENIVIIAIEVAGINYFKIKDISHPYICFCEQIVHFSNTDTLRFF